MPSRREIERLLAQLERIAAPVAERIFQEILARRGDVRLEVVVEALESGDLAAIARALGSSRVLDVLTQEMLSLAPRVMRLAVADQAIAEASRVVAKELKYSAIKGAVERRAREAAAKRVVAISQATERALREEIVKALEAEAPIRQLARDLTGKVGLDPRQMVSFDKEAAKLRAWAAEGKISLKKAEADIRKYRRDLLKYRAWRIARTEVHDAAEWGRLQTWRELEKTGQISKVEKEWVGILADGRICKVCHGVHGQRRELKKPFDTSLGPRDSPTAHPQCRCTMQLVRSGSAKSSKGPWVAPKRGPGLKPSAKRKPKPKPTAPPPKPKIGPRLQQPDIQRRIKSWETDNASKGTESALIVDPKGRQVELTGGKDAVEIPRKHAPAGSILTHNHPGSAPISLSLADLVAAADFDLGQVRAVGMRGGKRTVWAMRARDSSAWPDRDALMEWHLELTRELASSTRILSAFRKDKALGRALLSDAVNARLAEEFGLIWEVFK